MIKGNYTIIGVLTITPFLAKSVPCLVNLQETKNTPKEFELKKC